MDKIIVIGGGGHAKVVISILKKLNKYSIVGYTDFENKGNILGARYLGTDDILEKYFQNEKILYAALGIGQIKSSGLRRSIVKKLKDIGYKLPAIVSPQSIINEEVEMGLGTVVMDGVVINSGTKIGDYSIINTKASIDHDCIIGKFTHIAPGAVLSGEIHIGNNSFIGTGASIINGIKVGENCIIGAGSIVIDNLTKTGTYIGNPARSIID